MLRRRGAKVVRCDLNEHDRLMSVVLTLPHFLNVVLANTLRSIGTDPNLLSKIAGPTFRLQLLIAEAVHHESLDSELSILMDDAYSDVALKKYAKQSTIMLNAIVHETQYRDAATARRTRILAKKQIIRELVPSIQ